MENKLPRQVDHFPKYCVHMSGDLVNGLCVCLCDPLTIYLGSGHLHVKEVFVRGEGRQGGGGGRLRSKSIGLHPAFCGYLRLRKTSIDAWEPHWRRHKSRHRG